MLIRLTETKWVMTAVQKLAYRSVSNIFKPNNTAGVALQQRGVTNFQGLELGRNKWYDIWETPLQPCTVPSTYGVACEYYRAWMTISSHTKQHDV